MGQCITLRLLLNRSLFFNELTHLVVVDVDKGKGRTGAGINLLDVFIKESLDAFEVSLWRRCAQTELAILIGAL